MQIIEHVEIGMLILIHLQNMHQSSLELNKGIVLTGCKGDRGRKAYTTILDQNLIEPLLEKPRAQFQNVNGNEILGTPESPAKMQALHSSSALGVNIFQYWQKRGLLDEIAAACGFCKKGIKFTTEIVFEEKYPIRSKFIVPPNIDVVFRNNQRSQYKGFAVECKFSEAYSPSEHDGLKGKYLEEAELWNDLPAVKELAAEINPIDKRYQYLHAAQLIKHILGLKEVHGKSGFKLMYLWYDVVGKAGAIHRQEIEDFSNIVKEDDVRFHSMSYQELIVLLARDYRDEHGEYIQYITDRYL